MGQIVPRASSETKRARQFRIAGNLRGKALRTVTISILLAAGAALALPANAQEASLAAPAAADPCCTADYSPPTDAPPSFWSDMTPNNYRNSMEYGVSLLKANRFTQAEEIFAEILRSKKSNAPANFYMGVAAMNLGKWGEAKRYLEIAVEKKPEHPDPKSRLGVTYAKLGDTAGALALRADLVKMSDACKAECRLSPYITGGIEMIDEALAKP